LGGRGGGGAQGDSCGRQGRGRGAACGTDHLPVTVGGLSTRCPTDGVLK